MHGRCSVKINSPPVKSVPGGGQKHRDLERKGQFAIQVAVKTIVVAGAVSQQQRGRAGLPGVMTAFLKHAKGRWERLREN